MADAVGDALQQFLELTGRMCLSPAEYGMVLQEHWEDMPREVLLQLLTASVEKIAPAKRRSARLAWILPDMREGYESWRRAIGR